MLLSKSCVYGIRAALYLSSQGNEEYMPIRQMSEKLDISFHFLTKILQQMTAADLLESHKGPKGGVKLARDGAEITLMEVVDAIDGSGALTMCALGLPGCGEEKPCPLHETWERHRTPIREMLEHTSLHTLAVKGKEMNLRLTPSGGFIWD